MPLNLHLLRLFVTVVRAGTFSRAADVLHISQPAISKGVREFELQVGCRLLDRTPRGVRPTAEGQALVRHAEKLFAVERAAEDELLSLRALDIGSLRIGASTTIATYIIAEYLGIFHRRYPGIDLRLVSANTREVADSMAAHDIEVALVEGPVEDSGLISEAWRTDVMGLIVSPFHPLARSEHAVDCGVLADEILIVREPGSGSREIVTQTLRAHGVKPRRTLEIGSTEAIKRVVAAGIGVSIVSTATIDDELRLGRLKLIPIRNLRIERTLWQLRTPGRIDIPAASAFERILREDEPTPGVKLEGRLNKHGKAPKAGGLHRNEIDRSRDNDQGHQQPERARDCP
jgi:DNA-binding transcriptional LysR family regulator